MFRLDRDVLNSHPDLVFLDFTANDNSRSTDEETLSFCESLVRQVLATGVALDQEHTLEITPILRDGQATTTNSGREM